MNKKEEVHLSKFLSFVLRHQPEEIKLVLDANGWANVNELISKTKENRLENLWSKFEIQNKLPKERNQYVNKYWMELILPKRTIIITIFKNMSKLRRKP